MINFREEGQPSKIVDIASYREKQKMERENLADFEKHFGEGAYPDDKTQRLFDIEKKIYGQMEETDFRDFVAFVRKEANKLDNEYWLLQNDGEESRAKAKGLEDNIAFLVRAAIEALPWREKSRRIPRRNQLQYNGLVNVLVSWLAKPRKSKNSGIESQAAAKIREIEEKLKVIENIEGTEGEEN